MSDCKTLKFTVPGKPVGKERPRIVNGHAYTPQKTREYERLVQTSFAKENRSESLYGAVNGIIKAYFPIPKSFTKLKRAQCMNENVPYPHKPDADNIAKAILDALNGYAYHDDAAVVSLTVEKYYSDVPRVEVILRGVQQ